MQQLYRIESYFDHPKAAKWMSIGIGFTCMRKSFADGAWAMLTAHIGGNKKYRLVTDSKENPQVIKEYNTGQVRVN